jgi:O-acetyl-ADP-ribose deacetylase (regulator of RNase III)
MKNSSIGDITTVKSGIILHQVNAQGKMASGVAKAIRDKWPVVFDDYSRILGPEYTQKDSGRGFLGQVIWSEVGEGLWVASVVGQQFFGKIPEARYTSYDALDFGLREVADLCLENEVHYPMIGAGTGGGDWSIISAIINARFDKIRHRLWVLPAMAHMTASDSDS